MSPTEVTKHEESGRGSTARQEFGANQIQKGAETAATSIAARQRALVEARFLMSERHPRIWESVGLRLLGHCDRPRFAEIAKYCKPVGKAKNKVTGRWEESFAEGLSARFAEVARQEMGNIEATTSVVFEDDLIRIVSAGVSDLEHNLHDSREITVAKAVEKRGNQNRDTGQWDPPQGREILGNPRINTYGDPVWLVKATDDEIRAKQNSEISKTQRDATLRLIPKDIRDDCEERIAAVLADPKKVDPGEQKKRIMAGMSKMGIQPEDLMRYHGTELAKFSPEQWNELRLIGIAIKEGELTWNDAVAAKAGKAEGEPPDEENPGTRKLKDILDKKKQPAPETAKTQPSAETKPADSSASTTAASSQPTEAPKSAPTSSHAGSREPQTADPGDTLRDYQEFPDPQEDGARITVKGTPYVASGGSWKPANAKTEAKGKKDRGSLDFGS